MSLEFVIGINEVYHIGDGSSQSTTATKSVDCVGSVGRHKKSPLPFSSFCVMDFREESGNAQTAEGSRMTLHTAPQSLYEEGP
jgi:hypothetical protein